jgi:glycosyltransferase involved in cell wall biosynthesis
MNAPSKLTHETTISVVVPTKNSARTLERCLVSIRAQVGLDGLPLRVEIIVVDNASDDSTPAIGARLADQFETNGPERCAQRNRGMALASHELVMFIDSDMVLEPKVCAQTIAAFADENVGAVVVPEESFGEGFWAACRALEKRIAIGDPRTEAARGFRVSVLHEIGAWNEALTAAEDWDLTDRVIVSGRKLARTVDRIHHDEGRPTLRGTFQKKRYYGRWVAAYLKQKSESDVRSTDRRSRLSPLRILGKPHLLLPKPHLAAGLMTLKMVDAFGIGMGVLSARRAKS